MKSPGEGPGLSFSSDLILTGRVKGFGWEASLAEGPVVEAQMGTWPFFFGSDLGT
jgi:hypothetical protein